MKTTLPQKRKPNAVKNKKRSQPTETSSVQRITNREKESGIKVIKYVKKAEVRK